VKTADLTPRTLTPAAARDGSRPKSSRKGLTLVEVMIAMGIITITMLAVLGAFLQSRRVNDFQNKRAMVDNYMQGILEQLLNQPSVNLFPDETGPAPRFNAISSMANMLAYNTTNPPLVVRVELDTAPGLESLRLSPFPVLDPNLIAPGAIPVETVNPGYGNVDGVAGDDVGINTLRLDTKGTNGKEGTTNNIADDLQIHVMVWIDPRFTRNNFAQGGSTSVASRGITLIYTWTYTDGLMTRPMRECIRGISRPSS
jgi:prepilin-type N-terminal cleavage/methylation domain-containing protein